MQNIPVPGRLEAGGLGAGAGADAPPPWATSWSLLVPRVVPPCTIDYAGPLRCAVQTSLPVDVSCLETATSVLFVGIDRPPITSQACCHDTHHHHNRLPGLGQNQCVSSLALSAPRSPDRPSTHPQPHLPVACHLQTRTAEK
jgi:hypothetical protein